MPPERLGGIGLMWPGHAPWRGRTIAPESLWPDGRLVTTWRHIDRPDRAGM